MKIDTKLLAEIDDVLEKMAKIQKGSEEYKVAAAGLGQLLDRAIEIERLEDEREEKEVARKERRRELWIEVGKDVGKFGVMALLTVWGTIVCLNYEKTGIITTTFGKAFIKGLSPKNWA